MFETRKYMDYELAYQGYIKFDERYSEEMDIKTLIDRYNYETDYDLEHLEDYDYITIKDMEHNAIYFMEVGNLGSWYISGEVEVISYNGEEDTLFINNIVDIKDRLKSVKRWAIDHEYSEEDYNKEKESLEKVLIILESENK